MHAYKNDTQVYYSGPENSFTKFLPTYNNAQMLLLILNRSIFAAPILLFNCSHFVERYDWRAYNYLSKICFSQRRFLLDLDLVKSRLGPSAKTRAPNSHFTIRPKCYPLRQNESAKYWDCQNNENSKIFLFGLIIVVFYQINFIFSYCKVASLLLTTKSSSH